MNPTDTQSQQDTSASTDATARIGRGDFDRAAELGGPAAKVKRAAGRTVEQAKEQAGRLADTGKGAAADKIGGYSDRLRETARSAEEEDPNIAHLANSAADRLQQAADYVRGADLSRLRQDAANIAHRHPALFMGGMFALGLALGNLAKASVQSLKEGSDDSGDSRDGADDHYSESNEEAAGEILGGVSDSFDAEPRDQSPQL
jgi:hypothetical protein